MNRILLAITAASLTAAPALAQPVQSLSGQSLPVQSLPASAFTPAQRDEIIRIMRSALQSDPSILRDAIVSLQKQSADADAATTTAAVAANRPAIYATPGDPIAGNPDGSVTLVEFFDVRCPYCRRMLPVIDQEIRADGRLRLILKDLPILGPASVLGAQALLAAQAQGGYLKMQSALMADGATVDDATIRRAALNSGLDWPRLQHDMASPRIAARLDANMKLATRLGIQGTPAFVSGNQMISGALSLDELRRAVQ